MFPVSFDRSEQIIERACKLPVEIGSALFPCISRWHAQHMSAAPDAFDGDPKHVYGPNAKARVTASEPKFTVARSRPQIRAECAYRNRFRRRALREVAEQVSALLQNFLATLLTRADEVIE
jgi:hypothetical protein